MCLAVVACLSSIRLVIICEDGLRKRLCLLHHEVQLFRSIFPLNPSFFTDAGVSVIPCDPSSLFFEKMEVSFSHEGCSETGLVICFFGPPPPTPPSPFLAFSSQVSVGITFLATITLLCQSANVLVSANV